MHIREEQPADHPAIRETITAAFGSTAEADLVEELRADADAVIALVAEEGGQIVGHVMLSRMIAPFPALGLAPIAVRPDHEGEGVGSALIHAALDMAKRGDWKAVFVLGEPGYYRRFGFTPEVARGFDCAYAGPYLMALALGDALPTATGRVEYAAAFRHLPSE